MLPPDMDDPANIVDLRAASRQPARMDEHGAPAPAPGDLVAFDRREMSAILNIYGRMVAAGEWRDYAVDWLRDVAVFCIFRRAAETPAFRVEKRPKLRLKQGAYAVIGANGQVLKRGHDLKQVLRVFDAGLIRAVEG